MRKLMMVLAGAALLFVLATPMAAPVLANPGPQDAPQGQKERHPEIREAMRKLQSAKTELTKEAARDFGGHRANAAQHIAQALQELRLALQSDKR